MNDDALFDDDPDGPDERAEHRQPLRRWRSPTPRTLEEARESAALGRFMDLETMLYHLYVQRGVSDPNLYPIAPETLQPGYMGPEDDGFPAFGQEDADLLLANIGRLIAAMGGHLELQAVFPDTTITILVEPGPEHLHDGS